MARPLRIDAQTARAISECRRSAPTVAALKRQLDARGIRLARRTLDRWINQADGYAGAGAAASPASAPARSLPALGPPQALPPDPEGLGDDLESLRRSAATTWAAMAGYRGTMGIEPAHARAYAGLARLHSDLVARIVELEPAPDQERDRLAELGEAARGALIARATEAARDHDDLAGQLERAKRLLGIGHGEAGAEKTGA